jgi:hypothetical protein
LAVRQATSLWRPFLAMCAHFGGTSLGTQDVISNIKNLLTTLAEKPQDGPIVSDAYKIKSKLTHQKAGRKPQITRFSGKFIQLKRNLSF